MNAVDQYIRAVLQYVPPVRELRTRIETDLRQHIADAVASGVPEQEAIQRMGSPEDVAAGFQVAPASGYATAGDRLGGFFADVAIVFFPGMLFFLGMLLFRWSWTSLLPSSFSRGLPYFSVGQLWILTIPLVTVIFALGYFPVAEALWGRTVGKWLFGTYVMRTSGERVSLGRAFFRHLPWYVGFTGWGTLALIEAAWIFVGDKRQRACDIAADTVVVQGTPRRSLRGWVGVILLYLALIGLIALQISQMDWKYESA